MSKATNSGLAAYNAFCKDLQEGSILYNINTTNGWGEYLLVINKTDVNISNIKTCVILFAVLKKSEGKYIPCNRKISLTPDNAKNIPYLKYVGYCKFELLPLLNDITINVGLVSVYSETDLHEYTKKLNIRKPQKRKYGKNGKPVIRKLNN